ncbi:hypothetical protein [Blastococcus sp. Marseille-P5729]|uniref:hypothetical protein n=1 Tax=Blastococcus sp. Marseille-P5729 TaxID=2086582 RepID=UPI000D0E54FA|nr:hypothetical protein [Blastococcus sp. Marseille-P5729]
MSGPKIDIDQVQSAITIVDDAIAQMNGVTTKILAQSDATSAAITAPAGQITAAAFSELGGGGKALSEELSKLRSDLGTLIQVAQAGSDEATAAAKHGTLAATVAAGI